MRFLITLLMLSLLGSPAYAKSKAKPARKNKAAISAPSAFTGKLLSYEQLIRLPKAKRMTYMKNMVDLLATMESFNNRYTVAELETMRGFREQVAQLMQMLSLLPEARADIYADTPPPVDVSKIIPAWNGAEWTCGRGAVFDYVMRACMVTNAAGFTNHSTRSEVGDEGVPCPAGTQEVPHYRSGSVACIPNANWAMIAPERRSGINKGGFLSPHYLRDKPVEEQRAEILGGALPDDPASVVPSATAPGTVAGEPAAPGAAPTPGAAPGAPAAPSAPGAVGPGSSAPPAGDVATGTSAPPAAPGTCTPAAVSCKNLSAGDRTTAINRFRATAEYQGVNANVCIAGGFASKYKTAKKEPSTCEYKRSLDLGGGRKTTPCKADEALCNPVLFCVGGKNPAGQFEPITFCVKRTGDRNNRAITDSCAAKHAKLVANQIPLLECKPVDPKWSAAKKNQAKAACDAAKKVKGEACDPAYLPADVEFKKIWQELVAQTQSLRDVWCGKEDFAALFCRECEVVNDKIYAMNKDATGTGCPEVRAPAQGAPAAPAEPATPAPATPEAGAVRETAPTAE